MVTKEQIKIAQTLISKCHLRAQKDSIVLGFSAGRTEHVSELTLPEVKELIKYLRAASPAPSRGGENQLSTPSDAYQRAERMRRKIISLGHEMNWKLPGGKINMKSVDGWCKKYGYLHKPLDDYKEKELPKLITQFENVYKDFLNKL